MEHGPQSFLFFGPRHVGKRTVALRFAHELIGSQQEQGSGQPDCLIIEPEVSETTKSRRERVVATSAIRDIKQFLSLSPSAGRCRVVVVDRAEKLSAGAANALLKVLEEPPHLSKIILIATDPGQLLPTLRSRLFPVRFQPVDGVALHEALPGLDLPKFFFDLGLPGIIVDAAQSAERFQNRKDMLRQLFQISKLPLRKRIALAEALAQDVPETEDILTVWSLGLFFQAREREGREARARYALLDTVLVALRKISLGEGNARSVLERLLMSSL